MPLPLAPSTNASYGSAQFPGKRTATGPPTVGDVALSTSGMVGAGRPGVLMPGGTRPFAPTSGASNERVLSALTAPGIGQAHTATISSWTNGFITYSRIGRPFKDTGLDIDLMESGMIINTMRDKRTTTPRNNRMREWHNRHTGTRGYLHKRPLGNRHIMLDPIRTNFLLASTEPATAPAFQDNAWTADHVVDTWHMVDGIVLNQEGGKNVLGRVDDPGRERLLNMVVHGRIESVLNLWGPHLTTDSELFLVLKRCPRPAFYVLDPAHNEADRCPQSTSSGVRRKPEAADGIKRQAMANGINPESANALVKNPWQLVPFMPKGRHDRPTIEDTLGEDDHGNLVYGRVIRVGKVWFPGRVPRTSPHIVALQPLNNITEYLRCGAITVLMDNHGFRIRK